MVHTFSIIVILLGAAMFIPAIADLTVGNPDWQVFAVSAMCTLFFGLSGFAATRRVKSDLEGREVFIFVPLVWLISCFVCAVPLYLSQLEISFLEAFFESTSGLTTTGATVLKGLDDMPPGILLWRSLTQWIGGLGFVVMGMVLLPSMRSGGQQLFKLESSDKSDKPFAKARAFAQGITLTYLILSLACACTYFILGMSAFEAVNHAMTTVSTGGYSTSDQSMGAFDTTAILAAATFFMFVGGIPFLFLIRLFAGTIMREVQITFYLGFLVIATMAAYLSMLSAGDAGGLRRLVVAMFNVVSVVTTTGYASENYLLWGPSAVTLFFFLTFVGGCSGSTSGGFKMFRLVIIRQMLLESLYRVFRPHQLSRLKYGDRVIHPEVATSVTMFAFLYIGTFVAFAVIYGTLGLDFETAISASATALANVGPGIGTIIGPDSNFASLSDAIKLMLCFEMIVGRLEIMSVYVLLLPSFWD